MGRGKQGTHRRAVTSSRGEMLEAQSRAAVTETWLDLDSRAHWKEGVRDKERIWRICWLGKTEAGGGLGQESGGPR